VWINLLISRSKKQYSGITANTLKKREQRVDIIINSFEPQNHFVVSLHNETIFEVICYDHHNQTIKSSTLSTGFRAVVLKLILIAHHLWLPHCHRVPPCSRKSQCAKYNSIKSLETRIDTNAK